MFLCCGFGQRIFQKFISTGTGKILCRLYSVLCRQIRRRKYHFRRRPHGRNHATPALFDRKELQELQTDFHSVVGKKWNLQRGKEGSTAKHLDTMSYKVKKMKDEAVAAVLQASEAERRKEAAEHSQAHAKQVTYELEEKREQLQREVAPLQAAADVAQEYNSGKRKPNRKDVPALAADNARLRQELEYSIKDQHDVFQLYQKARRLSALSKDRAREAVAPRGRQDFERATRASAGQTSGSVSNCRAKKGGKARLSLQRFGNWMEQIKLNKR